MIHKITLLAFVLVGMLGATVVYADDDGAAVIPRWLTEGGEG